MEHNSFFFNEFPKTKDEKWSTEKDLSIETNPRSVALFAWEREANIGKLPSQKFQKQPPLAIYRKIDFSKNPLLRCFSCFLYQI